MIIYLYLGKWLWEDTGNYYGAGAYGLSVFDNTYEIHFKTFSDSTLPVIKSSFLRNAQLIYQTFSLPKVLPMKVMFLRLHTAQPAGLREHSGQSG